MNRLIQPVTINDAVLVSSTIPETDYTAWSSTTTYNVGDFCIRTNTHRIYQSLVASNLNNIPENNTAGNTPKWQDMGPTNRWAMFDQQVGTQTIVATSVTVVIAPGRVSALALMNINCASVRIIINSASNGGVQYDKTYSMNYGADPADWFQYFFNPIDRKSDFVVMDLPPYGDAQITVTLTDPTSVACGVLVVGTLRTIGDTEWGVKLGIVDYSVKSPDAFGNALIVKRSYSKRSTFPVSLPTAQVDAVAKLLASVRATPIVWIGADNLFSSLLIYGFFKDFEIDIAYPSYSTCSIEIEGMI
jgi:hypothetical protein